MRAVPDYSNLDQRLLDLIGGGYSNFNRLACRLHADASHFRGEPWRVVDRRLQALRKKGLITHDSKAGWMLAPQPKP